MINLIAPQLLVLYVLAASAIYIHFRGRERLVLRRQLVDHSTFLAPYNVLLYMFSGVPNKPVVPVETFPELKTISDNWQTIREEAVRLFDEGRIRAATANNDWGFYSFFKSGWKRFYLKWYDDVLPSAQALCPKTVALVQSIPSIKGAMFTVLPAGARLGGHRDPFAGSLRYHLGLVTPNSEDCRIVVDGVTCSYYDGKGFVFDETFIHWAENRTDTDRIIFFCDVERPMNNGVMRRINHAVNTHVVKISQSPNVEGEKVGGLNVVFSYLFELHDLSRKMKNWNRTAYYATKYTVMAALIGGLVLSAAR
ncbi:MAG: aspartyl/asparaginyl beta-hydroxylase domain-containing protein [Pseudolabrys sp.]